VPGEVTRSLRAFGSRRGSPGADHDRFFEPLLGARRRAEGRRDAGGRISEFGAAALTESIDAIAVSFASDRFPNSPPERRALTEALREKLQPLAAALLRMGQVGEVARGAPDETKFAAWRIWLAAVDVVFREADRAWLEMFPLLDAAPRPEPGVFRKLFGRRRAESESSR
jgi:hypothetical protein